MNTREIGSKLENLVSEYLKKTDPKSRKTIGSGSGKEIADVLSKNFYIECKVRNTKDITVKKDVWDKLKSEIPVGSLKTPLYILQNSEKDTLVVLDIKDFFRMIDEINAKEN